MIQYIRIDSAHIAMFKDGVQVACIASEHFDWFTA